MMPNKMTTKRKVKVKIGVAGATGRMGGEVLRAVAADADTRLTFAFVADGDDAVGTVCADSADEVRFTAAASLPHAELDVLIDFTEPSASVSFAKICRRRGIGMVIGTTGFSAAQLRALKKAAVDIPILVAQNMSVGVNALYAVAAAAARRLKAGRLGGGYDMEVFEAHHKHKKDAPSGTALRLGQALAQATGANFDKDAVFTRHGVGKSGRGDHDIGFSVVRGGDIVGEHRAIFAGVGEQLEIIHRSTNRANYATGAVQAAKFITAAPPGFYDGMDAVLGASVEGK